MQLLSCEFPAHDKGMESRCAMLAPGLMPECCALTSSAPHIYPVILSTTQQCTSLGYSCCVRTSLCGHGAMPKTPPPGSHSAQDLFHTPVLKWSYVIPWVKQMMGRLSSFISSALIYSEMSHGRARENVLESHWSPTSKCLYNLQCGQHVSYCLVQDC